MLFAWNSKGEVENWTAAKCPQLRWDNLNFVIHYCKIKCNYLPKKRVLHLKILKFISICLKAHYLYNSVFHYQLGELMMRIDLRNVRNIPWIFSISTKRFQEGFSHSRFTLNKRVKSFTRIFAICYSDNIIMSTIGTWSFNI